MIYLILMVNIILLVSGQVLWKFGVANITKWDMTTVTNLITSPFIIGGLFIYGIATFVWIYILSKLPLSVAYPLQSISYVIGMIIAYFLFKEAISINQWVGAVVIIIGVVLIAK